MISHPKLINILIEFAVTAPYLVLALGLPRFNVSQLTAFSSIMILLDGKEYLVTSFHIIYFICQLVMQMFMVWQRRFASSLSMTKTPKSRFVQAGRRGKTRPSLMTIRTWRLSEFLSHFCKTDFKLVKHYICRLRLLRSLWTMKRMSPTMGISFPTFRLAS